MKEWDELRLRGRTKAEDRYPDPCVFKVAHMFSKVLSSLSCVCGRAGWWWEGQPRDGSLGQPLSTETRFLEPSPWAQATPYPYMLTHSPQMLPLPQLPWRQQTRRLHLFQGRWCAPRLQDPPQGTMLAPALALGEHPNSRRLAPNSQAQRLQMHLVWPSGLRLITKCHLLSGSPLCWPQPWPPQVSIL